MEAGDAWLLGFAAEAIGAVSARREVNMVSSWTYDNAIQPLAVHFCSVACRDTYMQKLFGEIPIAVQEKRVVKRVRSTPVVAKRELTVVSRRSPVKAKVVKRKRKTA
jgi:hypothetical protein